jgi:hypothetical protein
MVRCLDVHLYRQARQSLDHCLEFLLSYASASKGHEQDVADFERPERRHYSALGDQALEQLIRVRVAFVRKHPRECDRRVERERHQ